MDKNHSSETTQWLPGSSRAPAVDPGSLGSWRRRGGPAVPRAALLQPCPGAELTWGPGRQLPGNLAARDAGEARARSSRGLAWAPGTRAGTATRPTPVRGAAWTPAHHGETPQVSAETGLPGSGPPVQGAGEGRGRDLGESDQSGVRQGLRLPHLSPRILHVTRGTPCVTGH